MLDICVTSVAMRSARTNSRAVEESSPRVELWNDFKHEQELVREYLLVPRSDPGTKGHCLTY